LLLQQLLNGLITGVLYGIAALGLGFIYGIYFVPNMAHGAIFMFGAYIVLVVALKVNYFCAILVGIVSAAFIMVISDALVFKKLRKRLGDATSMMIASIGIEYVLITLAELIWTADPRDLPVPWQSNVTQIGKVFIAYHRIIILVVAIFTAILIHYLVQRTKFGKAMRACAQDMLAAKILGINTERLSLIVFAISGGLAALAGGLIGPIIMVYPTMGNNLLTKCFAIVILGGGMSIPGLMAGGIVLGLAEALTTQYISGQYADVASFLILVLVLIIRPSGFFGKTKPVKV